MNDRFGQAVRVVHEFIGGGRELGDALTDISGLATGALGADMAGLTLNDAGGRATTVVYTDDVVAEIDQAQYDADWGPCLQALRERTVIAVEETDVEERWPEFTTSAARHGVHSTLSVPVVVGDAGIGALNLYAYRPAAFDDDMTELGQLFAGQAAIIAAYYDKAEAADHMKRAMESRATIEQAKGVVMVASGCSADEAFDILRGQSQAENRKLRDVADELVRRQRRRGQ